jgi:dihydrofolate synthase/folylpolyglutamate synthase
MRFNGPLPQAVLTSWPILSMTFNEALSYLLSLGHETLTIKLGLANTERLLAALGNPHKSFPSVQIAGTNGKGSTAVMLESICRESGIRVGLFTSPHLISITERIRIGSEEISKADFARLTASVKQTAEELVRRGELKTLPTFFEHVTAIALLAFHEAKVELAILETGLGGRLDSTTAAGAQIVALTPIAMDHEEYLGKTLAEIAAEKAAIIRPGVRAVIAPQLEEALAVVERRCREVGVTPRFVRAPDQYPLAIRNSRDSVPGRICSTFETRSERYENVCLGMRGRHQVVNAATAIALTEALRDGGFTISHDAIVGGLENANHPGRLELWEGTPPILFDGAHNPASAQALRDYLDEFAPQPVTMIFGAMRDKALNELAAILFPAAREVILTEFDNPRAATVEDLAASVPSSFDRNKLHRANSVAEALRIAQHPTDVDSLILVTGSLYLVGAARQRLLNQRYSRLF